MSNANDTAIRELYRLEDGFWRAWGEPLLDGKVSSEEYREHLMGFAADSYRVGLLTAAHLIEKRMGSTDRRGGAL